MTDTEIGITNLVHYNYQNILSLFMQFQMILNKIYRILVCLSILRFTELGFMRKNCKIGVRPRERFLDPTLPFNFVHDHFFNNFQLN